MVPDLAAVSPFAGLRLRPVAEMGLKELERIRLILRGGSVIEWRRLHFQSREEVDRFLLLQQYDVAKPQDVEWLRVILADAVEYLRRTFNYRVAASVAEATDIQDLFLHASGVLDKRHRKMACVVLKLMHVIQHIEAAELRAKTAVSDAEIALLVTARASAIVEEGRRMGLRIVEFTDSIKTRASTITKLIAKKDSTAAVIYDRTRFRLTVAEREDLVPTLYFLLQRLIPFNCLVPEQTENTLIRFKDLMQQHPNFARFAAELHLDVNYEERFTESPNRFSGGTFRMLNFVAEVPIRLDAYLPAPEVDDRARKGRVTLASCEFQMCDAATREENERGENAHRNYKARQQAVVLRRLSGGLVVPRKKKPATVSATAAGSANSAGRVDAQQSAIRPPRWTIAPE